ncbi:MAG: alpha/beta fold hydrolase [Armatimonadota bacterium]|nr:MAG: alpha/beta fold hydrolase [Armatimonadota bacterium]
MRIALCGCLVMILLAAALPAWAAVGSEYLELDGWAEPNTPPEHNKFGVLRYWAEGKTATAATIFIPGNGGGAASFDIVGRWLAENADIEVWAMDRRSNHLEDHTGTDQALKDGNMLMAGMYYMGGGFKEITSKDVPFLKHWGLRTHLNDVAALVKHIQGRGIKDIFLGGHSLGAMMTQAYAAYELDGGKPAYKDLRGLILFDGSVWGSRVGDDIERHIATLEEEISQGALFPADLPQGGIVSELIIIAATRDPEGASPIAPFIQDMTEVTSPLTNLALFGVAIDTDFNFHALCRAGKLGEPDAANPQAPLGWIGYQDSGEATDALALAKALTAGRGAAEWYQPLALMPDVRRASKAMLDVPELGLKYQKEMDLPVIGFLANAESYDFAEGMKEYAASIKGTADIHAIDPAGTYAHLDPIVAADADKRVFTPLKEWMAGVLAGK